MRPLIQHRNGTLYIDNSPLLTDGQFSYLSEVASVGDAQIFIQNYDIFADNQILLIEELGTETAEIVTVNGTPSAGGGAVLDSVLARSHPVGSKVYIIPYNQIELSHATSSGGSKTTLTTTLGTGLVTIQPDTKIQTYTESEFSSGYYYARYKNSLTATFSSYSDELGYGGWGRSTVGYLVERGLKDSGKHFSQDLTVYDCMEYINDGLQEIKGKRKRWPEHYKDNQIIGQTTRGTNVVSMPSDIYDTETNRSIVGLRIGSGNNLRYLDPTDFDAEMAEVRVTQVRTQAAAGATTLAVDNSYDFDDSGSLNIYVSGTKDSFTYTGVTRDTVSGATAAFTGIPASGDDAIGQTTAVDTYVWQNEVEGIPYCYTVRNGQIEFWYLPDSSEDNQNVYMDYNTTVTAVDSQADTIDVHRYQMLYYYLVWRLRMHGKSDNQLDMQDGWHLKYKEALNDTMRTSANGRTFRMSPKVNSMKRSGGSDDAWAQRLSVTDQ